MSNQSKSFLKLQRNWYNKLKDSGFEDIEQEDGNLKFWTSTESSGRTTERRAAASEEYYRIAGWFLQEHAFENDFEAMVWQEHSQGHSLATIVEILKKRGIKAYRDKLARIIRKLIKNMHESYVNGKQ